MAPHGSSARAKRPGMNGNTSMPISKKRLAEIAAIADEDMDTSDIPEADEEFFKKAKLVVPAGSAVSTVRAEQAGRSTRSFAAPPAASPAPQHPAPPPL